MSGKSMLRGAIDKLYLDLMKKEIFNSREVLTDPPGVRRDTFCDLYPCKMSLSPDSGDYVAMHTDGVGTKSLLAYIYWRETGDITVWRHIAHDAVVMNLDDVACAGGVDGPYYFTLSISRNKKYINEAVLKELLLGFDAAVQTIYSCGCDAFFCGGETADVRDSVNVIDVQATVFTPIKKDMVVSNHNIDVGDYIYGVQDRGVGCNGITFIRNLVLAKKYRSLYPEAYGLNPAKPLSGVVTKTIEELADSLALAPIPSYHSFIRQLIYYCKKYNSHKLKGLVHVTGGGWYKVLRTIDPNKALCFKKKSPFPYNDLFDLAGFNGKLSHEDLYRIFHMGHRLEIYMADCHVLSIEHDRALPLEIGKVCRPQVESNVEVENKPLDYT